MVVALRSARPGISITSDFIVGFPGESEAQYEDTVDLLTRVRFDSIFAFKYSPRPGTKANYDFVDDVPKELKELRLDRVLSMQRKITATKNATLVGQTSEILVTGYDRKKTGRLMGRLADNRIVNLTGNDDLIGSIVQVHITRALANSLEGEVLK